MIERSLRVDADRMGIGIGCPAIVRRAEGAQRVGATLLIDLGGAVLTLNAAITQPSILEALTTWADELLAAGQAGFYLYLLD